MYKCHVCFFNVCFSLFPVDGSFPNYMLNKDKFAPGQNFYVWPQVEEAPRQQLWLRKRKYNFACIFVIYEIGLSKVFSYSGSVPPPRVMQAQCPLPVVLDLGPDQRGVQNCSLIECPRPVVFRLSALAPCNLPCCVRVTVPILWRGCMIILDPVPRHMHIG